MSCGITPKPFATQVHGCCPAGGTQAIAGRDVPIGDYGAAERG